MGNGRVEHWLTDNGQRIVVYEEVSNIENTFMLACRMVLYNSF